MLQSKIKTKGDTGFGNERITRNFYKSSFHEPVKEETRVPWVKVAVPNLFGTRDWVSWKTIFPRNGVRGAGGRWFRR